MRRGVVSTFRASFFCLSLFGSNLLPLSFCTYFYFAFSVMISKHIIFARE